VIGKAAYTAERVRKNTLAELKKHWCRRI